MHKEFDAHGLPPIGRHVHQLVDPALCVQALMEDRLQNVTGGIGDVSILPVEHNGVSGAIPVPEAQCTRTSWYRKLLVERAISIGLATGGAAEAIGCVAHESGEGPRVGLRVRH